MVDHVGFTICYRQFHIIKIRFDLKSALKDLLIGGSPYEEKAKKNLMFYRSEKTILDFEKLLNLVATSKRSKTLKCC